MNLYYKICMTSHAMHLGDKWGILTLDLNCHFDFETLENVEPLIPKHINPWIQLGDAWLGMSNY
jgi:hypothetical protein